MDDLIASIDLLGLVTVLGVLVVAVVSINLTFKGADVARRMLRKI